MKRSSTSPSTRMVMDDAEDAPNTAMSNILQRINERINADSDTVEPPAKMVKKELIEPKKEVIEEECHSSQQNDDCFLLELAVREAVDITNYTDREKGLLRSALTQIMEGTLTIKGAMTETSFSAQFIGGLLSKVRRNYHRLRGAPIPPPPPRYNYQDKKDYKVGPPLNPSDTVRIAKIENTVDSVVKASTYGRFMKEKLKKACLMVIRGEYTLNGASTMMDIPSSTLYPYVRNARQQLGELLPPQAKGTNGNMKNIPNSSLTSKSSTPQIFSPISLKTEECSIDELDKAISDLLKLSPHSEEFKQSIFEATIMILTEGVQVAEASRAHNVSQSTLKSYVDRTRMALGLPISRIDTVVKFQSRPSTSGSQDESTPRLLDNQNDYANEEEIYDAVNHLLSSISTGADRKMLLFNAMVEVISGRLTIKDAAAQQGIPASTVHPYIWKVRAALGDRCPPAKLPPRLSWNTATKVPKRSSVPAASVEDKVTFDGITTPASVREMVQMIRDGKYEGHRGRPFEGTREQLREKFAQIVKKFKYRADIASLTGAMILVCLDDKTVTDACEAYDLAQTTVSSYLKISSIFVDFENLILTDETGRKRRKAVRKRKNGMKSPPTPPPHLEDNNEVIKQEIEDDY